MSTQTIIPAQTGAVATQQRFQVTRNNVPVTVMAAGLQSAEECDLYFSHDDGTTWTVLADINGNVVKLTTSITSVSIDSPMLLGVTKDATSAAAGVFVDKGTDS